MTIGIFSLESVFIYLSRIQSNNNGKVITGCIPLSTKDDVSLTYQAQHYVEFNSLAANRSEA